MSLTLTNIPRIMRSKGWVNGARLMETWFARPAATAPAYSAPVTSIITMDWALSYKRARSVYDQLMDDRIWANAAAQKVIAAMLRRQGKLGSTRQAFGDLSRSVELLDADYINYRAIGGSYSGSSYSYYYYYYSSGLDDMTAALGAFTFRVAVAGTVAPASGRAGHEVTITQIGIYLRDSFDFNGDQFLGFWDDSDNSVSAVNWFSGTGVSNSDFRKYRDDTGWGGDFLVYSNVQSMCLVTPDTFIVT
jgi:hypothetical protein